MDRKLLFVAARLPWPLDTGAKIRAWYILSGLAVRFSIDMLVYGDGFDDEEGVGEIKKIGVRSVIVVQNPALNQPYTPVKVVLSLLRGVPVSIPKYQSVAFTGEFVKMLANEYDVIHFEHIHVAAVLKSIVQVGCKKTFISLDAHNVEWQIAKRMGENEASLLRKLVLKWQMRNMYRFEKQLFRAADAVMAVSREDADSIDVMTNQRTSVVLVENGVDVTYFTSGMTSETIPGRMAFVGSMDWHPNVDGMIWFVHDIFPRIKKMQPGCSLDIDGRNPHRNILGLHNREQGINVTGNVDDVRPYVHSAEVVVVPLRYGGGTRLKILEAFAMSKAVVSTSLGCEGINCKDEDHLLIRDDSDEFATAVVRLMDSTQLRESIGVSCLNLVENFYSWPIIQKKLISIY